MGAILRVNEFSTFGVSSIDRLSRIGSGRGRLAYWKVAPRVTEDRPTPSSARKCRTSLRVRRSPRPPRCAPRRRSPASLMLQISSPSFYVLRAREHRLPSLDSRFEVHRWQVVPFPPPGEGGG